MQPMYYIGLDVHKRKKELHPRSSEARRENFCPLDKDLSWKSRYRTSGFCPIFTLPVTAFIVQVEDICHKPPRTLIWITSGFPTIRSESSRFIRGQYWG
jgi:hypothetical protein